MASPFVVDPAPADDADGQLWFRQAFDAMPVAATLQNPDLSYALVNDAFCRLVRRPREQLIGRSSDAHYHPEDREKIEAARDDLISGRATRVDVEARFLSEQGEVAWLRFRTRATEIGGRRFFMSAVLNVTAVHERERSLTEAVELYRVLFEESPIPTTVQGDDFRILSVNRAYCEWIGYSADELVGKDPIELHPPEFREDIRLVRAGMLPGNAGGGMYREMEHRDGRRLPYRVHFRRMHGHAGRPYTVAVIVDMGQERAAQAQAEAQAARMTRFFEQAPVGMVLRDPDGEIRAANRALERLSGYSAGELLGRRLPLFGETEESLEQSARAEWRVAADNPGWVSRTRVPGLTRGGQVVWTEQYTTAVEAVSGEVALLTVVADITEEKRLDDELHNTVRQLEHEQDKLVRSNGELSALFENDAVAIVCLADRRIVRCNRCAEAMLGAEGGNLVGRSFDEFLEPSRRNNDLLHGAGPAQARGLKSLWLRRQDGSDLACLAHFGALRQTAAGSESIVVLVNTTEHEAAQQALAQSRAYFRHFVEVIDEVILVIDASGYQLRYVNQRYEEVFGGSALELQRDLSSLYRTFHARDQSRFLQAIAAAASGTAGDIEVGLEHPVRGRRVLRLRLFPLREFDAEVYVVAQDVTDRHTLEAQRLAEAIRQRDALVREVHHRIKNNLQGVAGLLQQSAVRRPELGPFLADVANQIQAISHVHGLQYQGGSTMPRRIALAVFESLSRTFQVAMPFAEIAGAADGNWTLPEQEAVPLALIVNEIATNAIRHRAPGGRIGASFKADEEGVRLIVWNEGALPDGFRQESVSTSSVGLGLVKALLPRRGTRFDIRQHGRIVVTSLELRPPVLRPAVT